MADPPKCSGSSSDSNLSISDTRPSKGAPQCLDNWLSRMRAAFAKLPSSDDADLRAKFLSGVQFEFVRLAVLHLPLFFSTYTPVADIGHHREGRHFRHSDCHTWFSYKAGAAPSYWQPWWYDEGFGWFVRPCICQCRWVDVRWSWQWMVEWVGSCLLSQRQRKSGPMALLIDFLLIVPMSSIKLIVTGNFGCCNASHLFRKRRCPHSTLTAGI